MGDYLRDLTLRFVILGWIYAKNARHNRLLGHVFQPSPPAYHRSARRALPWVVLAGLILVGGVCTTRASRQALSAHPRPVS